MPLKTCLVFDLSYKFLQKIIYIYKTSCNFLRNTNRVIATCERLNKISMYLEKNQLEDYKKERR